MIGLGIDKNVFPAREMQREQTMRFRNVQPEWSGIELFAVGMSPAEKPLNALLSLNILLLLLIIFSC